MATPEEEAQAAVSWQAILETALAVAVLAAIAVLLAAVARIIRPQIPRRGAPMPGRIDLSLWPHDIWVTAVERDIIPVAIDAIPVDERAAASATIDAISVLIKDADAEMQQHIADTLDDLIASGADANQLRDAVAQILDPDSSDWSWRATRIARTTATAAAGASVEARAQEAAKRGLGVFKQWWATPDGRTRPAHWAAHGQVVPVGERFSVGGFSLLFPGDPTAPANLTINCRCVSILVTDPAEATQEAQAYVGRNGGRVDLNGHPIDSMGNAIIT